MSIHSRLLPRPLFPGAMALSVLIVVGAAEAHDGGPRRHSKESHLGAVRQLTFDSGENAEAYWSPDGKQLVFQSTRPPRSCDQIFTVEVGDSAEHSEFPQPRLVSTGTGRTTCGYFDGGGDRIIFSSTHAAGDECPPVPDRSQGYVWPLYDSYEIYSAKPDGSDLQALTAAEGYDAEATVCPVDGSIVFTSTRDGDLELYRMDADGSNVKRLTEAPGYDGGAFFSPDCSKIVWRASRPAEGKELDGFRALLDRGLVRPGELEIWVAEADGSEARQVTYLGGAAFAPFFYPSGDRIIFSSNHHTPSGREFDLWAVDVNGTDLERITYTPGFDGFPMFSPDGKYLAFASNRNQAKDHETDLYVAEWIDGEPQAVAGPADRFLADVAWLADDEREGRGVGTEGLAAAASWLAETFASLGLEPVFEGDYRQGFDVPVEINRGEGTSLSIDGEEVAAEDYAVLGFSASGRVGGPAVAAGYGIFAHEHGIDDYDGVEADGALVVVRRYTPKDGVFESDDLRRRYGDLRQKAFTARERGAKAVLVVDMPLDGNEASGDEGVLPRLSIDTKGDAGLPLVVVKRSVGKRLLEAERVDLTVELVTEEAQTHNVLAKLSAGHDEPLSGAILVGAHYDHLGMGGPGSLAPDSKEAHNGADDNASGVAALLEAARILSAAKAELRRDVYFAAFSAEESGLLGSAHLTREPPAGFSTDDLAAMINMDMVGRLRGNRLSVLGADSAEEWTELVEPACAGAALSCAARGDGYGPSDQTTFYAAGVPVLHLFTGAHEDYHKPSDDWQHINAAGGARIAALAADLARGVANRAERLTYKESTAPAPAGDARSFGASLGTIPDYAGPPDGKAGVLLAGVRPEGPADKGGLTRGDLIVELAGREIRDIHDLMFVLRDAKPGDEAVAVVERSGERLELPIVFGERTRVR